eukprot:PhF_6_TR43419/c2_g1_i1/m.66711
MSDGIQQNIKPKSFSVPNVPEALTDTSSLGKGYYDTMNEHDEALAYMEARSRARTENMNRIMKSFPDLKPLPTPPSVDGDASPPQQRKKIYDDGSSSILSGASEESGFRKAQDPYAYPTRQATNTTTSKGSGSAPSVVAGGQPLQTANVDVDEYPVGGRRNKRGVDTSNTSGAPPKATYFTETQSIPDSVAGGDLYSAPYYTSTQKASSINPNDSKSSKQQPQSSEESSGFSWGLLSVAALGGIAIGAGVGVLLGHFLLAPVAVTTTVPVAGATFGGASSAVVGASNAAGPAAVTAATNAGNAAVTSKAAAVTVQTQMVNAAHNAALNSSVPAAAKVFAEAGITNSVTTTTTAPYLEAAVVGGTCGAIGALGAGAIAMKVAADAQRQRIDQTQQK